jgi:starvation-inducible DNA-binding protein
MMTAANPSHPSLDEPRRTEVASRLQVLLVELIDLTLQAKQARWNVVGGNFRLVHQQLDEIIDTYREWSDSVAERVVALGVNPDGRAATVAGRSPVEAMPLGYHEDTHVVGMFIDRLSATAVRARTLMEELAMLDAVSQDILIDVVKDLEEDLWMLQAQQR